MSPFHSTSFIHPWRQEHGEAGERERLGGHKILLRHPVHLTHEKNVLREGYVPTHTLVSVQSLIYSSSPYIFVDRLLCTGHHTLEIQQRTEEPRASALVELELEWLQTWPRGSRLRAPATSHDSALPLRACRSHHDEAREAWVGWQDTCRGHRTPKCPRWARATAHVPPTTRPYLCARS